MLRPESDGGGFFKVFVDDRQRGKVESGNGLAVPVEPGRHAVRLRYLWISSRTVEVGVDSGEIAELEAKRAFGFGPFDVRYFTQRRTAIELAVATRPSPAG